MWSAEASDAALAQDALVWSAEALLAEPSAAALVQHALVWLLAHTYQRPPAGPHESAECAAQGCGPAASAAESVEQVCAVLQWELGTALVP